MTSEILASRLCGVLVPMGIGAIFWSVTRIDYVVDEHYLRVILGAVTLRRIALSDIAFIDTQAPFWNEHWCNCFFACGRVVRIRRKSGWVRNFIITPKNREALMALLQSRLGA